jgi:hypothetical protein
MRTKGQSAVEFLTTYSFTFLIIALIIFLLFLYSSLPKTVLPEQCSFYGGFNCLDVVYYNLGSAPKSQLVVVASDMEPGTVNSLAFNAIINYVNSNSGFCVTNSLSTVSVAGNTIYCVANFISPITLGYVYNVRFNITANYCANSPGSLSNHTCIGSSNGNYVYAGQARTQGTGCTNSIISHLGLSESC